MFPLLLCLGASVGAASPSSGLDAGIVIEQGTVGKLVELGGTYISVRRLDVDQQGRVAVRLTVMPPDRAWTATGQFVAGEHFGIPGACLQVASLVPAQDNQRGTVLLRRLPHAGCAVPPSSIPLYSGDSGSLLGQTRFALIAPADDSGRDGWRLAAWPAAYTLASCPPDQVQTSEVRSGQVVRIDEHAFILHLLPADELGGVQTVAYLVPA